MKKPTRRDLLLVIGELQGIIGSIGSAYDNDRQASRADAIQPLVQRGFELCVAALGADPPLSGTWRPRKPPLTPSLPTSARGRQ